MVLYKNSKLVYYIRSFFFYFTPKRFCKLHIEQSMEKLTVSEQTYVKRRISYYNKLSATTLPVEQSLPLSSFLRPKKKKGHSSHSSYFFDTYEYTRYFKDTLRIAYRFGDVTEVPAVPSFVKSRPIAGNNENSVLLKLNKVRHFRFLQDPIPYAKKQDKLVGRAVVHQPKRILFWEKYFGHPMCNLGSIDKDLSFHPEWHVGFLSIQEHLRYKFILCIEGNDVATNLKWVMSSNSLAVMPPPVYETWFMEGTLIPDYHYIAIKADYSDLEERLQYYLLHTDKALAIIEHAHEYVRQFMHPKREKLISQVVIQQYFEKTGQL